MTIKKNQQKPLAVAIFILLGILAMQIPFTKLLGAQVRFTLFDLFAPIAGKLFASLLGVGSVFAVMLGNFLIHGSQLSAGSLIRFFPTLFATWYFGSRKHYAALISLVAFIAFNLHPIGRTVWYYSLFWTIPPLMTLFKNKNVLARALGSTFTAHAVGGAVWIWVFNLPADVWRSLIPIVILERAIFTLGIAASYIFAKYALKQLKFTKLSATASA